MKKLSFPMIIAAALTLSACSDDNDTVITPPPPPQPDKPELQVVHAIADAPAVNVKANGNLLLSDVDFTAASAESEVDAASYDISVEAILPDGSTSTVDALSASFTAANETNYLAVAIGRLADSDSVSLKLISNPDKDIADGNTRVQVLHAAPAVGMVDIYVTAPAAELGTPTLSGVDFSQNSEQLEIAAGNYQIRITAKDSKTPVYDSGSVALAEGEDYLVTAITNTGTGDSPVSLLAVTDEETPATLIPDAGSKSDIRVIHAVADAPAVDVFLNDATTPAVNALEFKSFTPYVSVDAGDYSAKVAADADNSVVVLDDADFSTMLGNSYSLIAVDDTVPFSVPIQILGVEEDRRRVATEAKVRITHGSPTAGTVDIYVTATNDISEASPLLEDIPFGATTDVLKVTPGQYVLQVTPANSKDVALGPLELDLKASGIYGAIAVDNTGGGTPLGVILLDDFNPSTDLQVVHAISDAPAVNVNVNGAALLSDVGYAVASGELDVAPESYSVTVDARLPDGSTSQVDALSASFDAMRDTSYKAVAIGSLAKPDTVSLKLIANDMAQIADGYTRVQVLHAAPDAGMVDIYVTAPGAELSSPTLSAVDFGQNSDPLEITAGDYQVRITAKDSMTPVYDSGTVALSAGEDYLLTAIANTGTGSSPVALLAVTDEDTPAVKIRDAGSQSAIRVVHAVADAPAVDVFLNGSTTPAVDALAFKSFTDYVSVATGDYTATIAADADNSVVVLDNAAFSTMLGMSYSLIAADDTSPFSVPIQILDVEEDRRRVATEAKVRITHASASAGMVDIYVTASNDISEASPLLEDVPFGATTSVLKVMPGDYVLQVTAANTKTVAIGPLDLSLAGAGIYGAIAVDNTGGGTPLGVILLDDFTNSN